MHASRFVTPKGTRAPQSEWRGWLLAVWVFSVNAWYDWRLFEYAKGRLP